MNTLEEAATANATGVPFARKRGRKSELTTAYRLEVASRALAAIIGGFALASAVAWLVSFGLMASGVQPRGPATSSGTVVSWLVWSGAAMWAFYARSQIAAWGWILAPAAALSALAFLLFSTVGA